MQRPNSSNVIEDIKGIELTFSNEKIMPKDEVKVDLFKNEESLKLK